MSEIRLVQKQQSTNIEVQSHRKGNSQLGKSPVKGWLPHRRLEIGAAFVAE